MTSAPNDKVVVITGASRGIGLEMTRQYSSEPNTFVVAVVRQASAANFLQPLVAQGHVAIVEADMTKPETFDAAAKQVTGIASKVDILIKWFSLNTIGPVCFTKALLPLLRKSAIKKVVNVSSFLGTPAFHKATDGKYNYVSYSVAKGALNFATLKYHQEFKDQGFTIISLNPGYVQTELHGTGKDKAPLTVEDSVSRCNSFVDRVTTEQSGQEISLDGSLEPLVY